MKRIRITKDDYRASMRLIEKYFDSEPHTLEGIILNCLVLIAEKYEKKFGKKLNETTK
jgi:hypothetical protein